MQNLNIKVIGGVLGLVLAATTASPAAVLFSTSTGVDSNNNIQTIGKGSSAYKVDANWTVAGYYDSYGLTRADVFGKGVSNPNGMIGDPISSPSATRTFGYSADVITGGNRPGWYNPGDGAQWLGASLNENNGGAPVDPPGNYVFQLDLSKYINPNGGLVSVDIGAINADNHYELAINGSVAAESYLAKAFATQETWNKPGDAVQFSFSPKDGAILDVIVANSNDQLRNGVYYADKNPTGFLIDNLTVTQASGPTPARDTMTSTAKLNNSAAPNSGPVFQQRLVSAPEPGTWVIMAAFIAITAFQVKNKKNRLAV